MTLLAPALQAFFTDRLITQRNSSPQTIAAYRDTFILLLTFAQRQTGKAPFQLDIDDLDAPLIGAFLTQGQGRVPGHPRRCVDVVPAAAEKPGRQRAVVDRAPAAGHAGLGGGAAQP